MALHGCEQAKRMGSKETGKQGGAYTTHHTQLKYRQQSGMRGRGVRAAEQQTG